MELWPGPEFGVTIPTAVLAKMQLDRMVTRVLLNAALKAEHVAAQPGLQPDGADGISLMELAATYREQQRTIERAALGTHRRRSITDDLLKEVAEIALSNPARPTSAVADKMSTSKRNATRWIKTAGDRGFLPKVGTSAR